MTDLRHLIDHPPREPSPPPRPAFTAQVMRRVREQAAQAAAPAVATATATTVRTAPAWTWWVIGLAGTGVLTALIPGDLGLGGVEADLGNLVTGLVGDAGELILATAAVTVVALVAAMPARMRGRHG